MKNREQPATWKITTEDDRGSNIIIIDKVELQLNPQS